MRSAENGERPYRVEAERAEKELLYVPAKDIDLTKYKSIVRISVFDAEETCNNDYVIAQAGGTLYRIEYRSSMDDRTFFSAVACLSVMFLITFFLLVYIGRKIIQPFTNMSDLALALAKGNLSAPVKEEKSKYFGKFLWSVDMLREHLEDNKERELALQKDKKTLILSLSHDIKTPLSAIELYTKALLSHLYDSQEKQETALNGISNNVNEIKGYVDKIVSASREDFLQLEVKNGEFYLSALLDRTKSYYKEKLSVIHTELIIENTGDCLLAGDIDRTAEVLQNIMENAIKYGDGIQIKITVSEEEDCRLITVGNTGCQLQKEELPHIFDSFYRGSNSTGVKGSGLGLYICRVLMRKMGGEVFADIKDDLFNVSVVIRKA